MSQAHSRKSNKSLTKTKSAQTVRNRKVPPSFLEDELAAKGQYRSHPNSKVQSNQNFYKSKKRQIKNISLLKKFIKSSNQFHWDKLPSSQRQKIPKEPIMSNFTESERFKQNQKVIQSGKLRSIMPHTMISSMEYRKKYTGKDGGNSKTVLFKPQRKFNYQHQSNADSVKLIQQQFHNIKNRQAETELESTKQMIQNYQVVYDYDDVMSIDSPQIEELQQVQEENPSENDENYDY